MHWLKRLILVFFLLLTLSVAAGLFVRWEYADDVKEFVLERFRSSLTTEVHFDSDAEFSVWKDFPKVAVGISHVTVQDAFLTDTLLSAGKVFVQFDLLKILRNDLTIAGIRLSDGFIRLRRTDGDRWNFRVWNKDSKTEEKKSTDLNIEILTLDSMHLDYDDRTIDLNIQFLCEESRIKGHFTDTDQHLSMTLEGFLERLTTGGQPRVADLPLSLAGVLNIRSKAGSYSVDMGNAVLAGNEMVWDGAWQRTDDGMQFDLNVHAGNINPEVLLPHLWPQMPARVRKLAIHGRTDVTLSMNGPFTRTSGPELDATVRMRNGALTFQGTEVSDLNFEGKLSMKDIKRSKAMRIAFPSFSLRSPKGKVKGSGTLTNLSNPVLNLSSSGNSRLEEIISVAGISDDLKGSGNVAWDIDFSGPLGKDFQTSVQELKRMEWSGEVDVSDAELQFNPGIPPLKDLRAKVVMKNGNTSIESCSGELGHVHFEGAATIARLRSILTEPDAPIDLDGHVHIKELDIGRLPEEWALSGENAGQRNVSVRLQTEADTVRYHRFTATGLSGHLTMKNGQLEVNGLSFHALGGNIRSDLSFRSDGKTSHLHINATVAQVDMARTLSEWDDFGQTMITSKQLKGTASASLQADLMLDPDYQVIPESMHIESDLTVSNGELVGFEPLKAMSRFISVDELRHVRFDTLRNHLTVRNSRLIIPRMSVSSNILNVDVFGEHGFDQEMDYHVNLLLNDLIRRKAKARKTFEGHEIVDSKGKTRLYLWVRGRPGDLKVGFDRREVRRKLKEGLRQEGRTIKQLFNGDYRGDETEQPARFKLEDDADETIAKDSLRTEKAKKRKHRFLRPDPPGEDTEGKFEIEFDP